MLVVDQGLLPSLLFSGKMHKLPKTERYISLGLGLGQERTRNKGFAVTLRQAQGGDAQPNGLVELSNVLIDESGCYTSDFLKKCISSQTPRDMGKQTCITLMENSGHEFRPTLFTVPRW